MKAILVIDKPESCFMCPFRQKVSPDDIKCWAKDEIFEERFSSIQTRINCPLKPIPERKCEKRAIEQKVRDLRFESGFYVETLGMEKDEYAKGFNACIEEITGETE